MASFESVIKAAREKEKKGKRKGRRDRSLWNLKFVEFEI